MTSLPEEVFKPGSVIKARGRIWRVLEADDSFVTAESLDGVWKASFYLPLESAAISLEASPEPPPKPATDPSAHQLYLEVEHLRTLQADAPFLALQRSRVVPHNFQLVPLLMALENPASVRLLIADDVGLGKTIEAGLIIKELFLRRLARRVLVLTPAHLKEVWHDALKRFFHLHFEIMGPQLLRKLPPGKNPWNAFELLIASIDLAKHVDNRGQVLAQPWDLVVVDEAHLASRIQGRHERFSLVRQLAERAPHVLLVTATPHSGDPRSFASLIEHLDPENTLGLVLNDSIQRERARRHVVQRTRQDVLSWYEREGKKAPFPKRDARPVSVRPSRGETELFAAISEYARLLAGERENTPAHWLAMHFLRRASSSPLALYRSLQNRIRRIGEIEQLGEEAESPPPPASLFDTPGEQGSEEEFDRAYDVAWLELGRTGAELGFLEKLEQALAPRKNRPDSKFKKLVELLEGELAGKKTILFTRYRDTLDYLTGLLAKRLDGVAVLAIHGGHDENEREDVLSRFAEEPRAVLVATDVISEGLNLQYHASQVIHYELPWNPNRLEQRNGRVDRFGQPEPEVRVRMLFYENSLDAIVFRRLINKAERIKAQFGVVPNYLGDEKYVRATIEQALSEEGALPRSQEAGLFEAAEESDEALASRALTEGFYNQSIFKLPDVERALEHAYGHLTRPQHLNGFFARGAAQFGWHLRQEGDLLRVAAKGRPLQSFDPKVGDTLTFNPLIFDPNVEKLDLSHPAVVALMEQLRAAAWSEANPSRTGVFTADVNEPVFLYLFRARFEGRREVAETLYPEARTASGEPLPAEEADRLLKELLAGGYAPANGTFEALLSQALAMRPSGNDGRNRELKRLIAERQRIARNLEAAYGRSVPYVDELTQLAPLGEPEWLALTLLVGGES